MTYRTLMFGVSNLIAAITLMLAFGLEQYWGALAAALGFGLWGWFGLKKVQNAWSADLYLAGVVLLVTLGGLLDLSTYLLFIAILGTLGVWDLVRFHRRISHSPESKGILQVEKRHFALLGLTLLIAAILASFMMMVQIQISFGITLAFGVILIITLGQIVRLLRS